MPREKPIFKTVVCALPKKRSTNEICLDILGITKEQLIADILENKDGKYDKLYM